MAPVERSLHPADNGISAEVAEWQTRYVQGVVSFTGV